MKAELLASSVAVLSWALCLGHSRHSPWAALVAEMVKNRPASAGAWVPFLRGEDSLEGKMATHASILVWRILWAEEPGSPWGHKESDVTEWLATLHKQLLQELIQSYLQMLKKFYANISSNDILNTIWSCYYQITLGSAHPGILKPIYWHWLVVMGSEAYMTGCQARHAGD